MSDPTPTTPVTVQDRITMALSALETALSAKIDAATAGIDDLRQEMRLGLFTQTEPTSWPYLIDVLDGIDAIRAVLGARPYESTETANIRAILLNIMNASGRYGISPDGGAPATISLGTVTLDGWRYVAWAAITGIIVQEQYKLAPSAGWSGVNAYIQTDAPTVTVDNFTASTTATISPNSWYNLAPYGNAQIGFRVPSQYAAVGYLRRTNTYYTAPAVLLTEANGNKTYFAQWPEGLGATPYMGQSRIFASQNPQGWRFRNIGAGNVTMTWQMPNNSLGSATVGSAWYTASAAANWFWLWRLQSGGTFTIQAVPPGFDLPA